jgi:hypothetical protein
MKEIILSNNMLAFVDDEDFDYLNQFKWQIKSCRNGNHIYAQRTFYKGNIRTRITMHTEIFVIHNIKILYGIDHIDGNGLNNQKSNLRLTTASQNQANAKLRYSNISGFKGVSWNKFHKKWFVQIQYQKESIFLGLYDNLIEAALIYDNAAKRLFKDHARLNFPEV